MVRLVHPNVDGVIDRNPRQARVLAESGWVPLDTADDSTADEPDLTDLGDSPEDPPDVESD